MRHRASLIIAAGLSLFGPALYGQDRPNLIPNPGFKAEANGLPAEWRKWAPRTDLSPRMSLVKTTEGPALSIDSDTFPRYGQWNTLVRDIKPGAYYSFDVLWRAERVSSTDVSVAAMLSWCEKDCTEPAIQRDYVDKLATEGKWLKSFRTLRAPKRSQAVKVELVLRYTAGGSVLFRAPRLVHVDPPKPRIVKVATTHLVPPMPSTGEANIKLISDMLDRLGKEKVDVVCLSENVVGRGVPGTIVERARKITAPAMKMLSEKARQHRMYVLTTLEEYENARVYNAAVLYDRDGNLVANYRKMHLPLSEAEEGYTPGNNYVVLDTDFGKVGILTCWDNWFSEPARIVRMKGAELVLFPVAGDGGSHWDIIPRARAIDNGVYIIASSTVGQSPSRIIDPSGEIIAEADGPSGYAIKEIDLNREWRSPWLSIGPGLGEGKSLYIKERRPDTYGPLGADSSRSAQ